MLTATLIKDTGMQRFYRLNHKLTKGYSVMRGVELDLIKALAESKEKDFKPEYKECCPLDGANLICISDATTHLERLVFVGVEYGDSQIGRTRVQIDGSHTFLIHGGNSRSMKPDAVYLRRLAMVNGLTFHHSGILNKEEQ